MISARQILFFVFLGFVPSTLTHAEEGIKFNRDILPILSNKCFACHGPDEQTREADLRLDVEENVKKPRDGYAVIDTNSLAASELIERIFSTDAPMPPADAEKQLTDDERNLLKRWVLEGGEYTIHWAYVPPVKSPPAGSETLSRPQIIDAFVQQKLNSRGLELAPRAKREILARRAALVLTGLPPNPQELDQFLGDLDEGAYERYLDRLLANPRYGEHQARYWLDAVRYGDTHGLHLDNRRGIYPYRDWVISAFNRNLPFDQFITWQLAGDLFPDPTLEQLVATGYVRMNPTTAEGGAIPEEFQAKNNFDRVENLGTVFLGMSLTCARCHSHKYDPVPQQEYYRLLAFFNNTAEHSMDGNKYEYQPVVNAPSNLDDWQRWRELAALKNSVLDKVDHQLQSDPTLDQTVRAKWDNSSREERWNLLVENEGFLSNEQRPQETLKIHKQLTALEKTFSPTLVAKELPEPRVTRLLERGEYNRPVGDPLQPGVIRVLGELPDDFPRNRLGLARWLTSRNHPLVSRVLVNRIWQRVFGAGLVRTPEDFGLQGQRPTHPAMLDWLAVEFQESDWDLKQTLKMILMSQTFQQESRWREEIKDPENLWLARGPSFRLDAEVIRDIGLWAAGLLEDQTGGEGIKPYQPKGLWSALMHPASNTKLYERDTGEKLYRRSLYIYWKRTSPHPMMTLFDAPSRESSCVRRSRTNTPLQSLGLLNETQRLEVARVLSSRLLSQISDDNKRLDFLFTLLASRSPTPEEQSACLKLLEQMRTRYRDADDDARALLSIGEAKPNERLDRVELAAWTQLSSTVLASDLAIMLY